MITYVMLPVVLAGMPISSRGIPFRAVSINIRREMPASVMAIASAPAKDDAGTSCRLKHFKQHPRQAPDTLVTFHEASQKPYNDPFFSDNGGELAGICCTSANDLSINKESCGQQGRINTDLQQSGTWWSCGSEPNGVRALSHKFYRHHIRIHHHTPSWLSQHIYIYI